MGRARFETLRRSGGGWPVLGVVLLSVVAGAPWFSAPRLALLSLRRLLLVFLRSFLASAVSPALLLRILDFGLAWPGLAFLSSGPPACLPFCIILPTQTAAKTRGPFS